MLLEVLLLNTSGEKAQQQKYNATDINSSVNNPNLNKPTNRCNHRQDAAARQSAPNNRINNELSTIRQSSSPQLSSSFPFLKINTLVGVSHFAFDKLNR